MGRSYARADDARIIYVVRLVLRVAFRLILGDAFVGTSCRSFAVMELLVADIIADAVHVIRVESESSKADLPRKINVETPLDFSGGLALQIPKEFRDGDSRWDCCDGVHMIGGASDHQGPTIEVL